MSILKKFDLTGKCALINHPEQVYGREIAAGLMDAGTKVWFSGPDLAALEDLAGALAEEGHEVSGIFRYSQGTREAADALGEAVKEEMPSLDIIVENSSGMHMTGWDQSFEDIYRQLTVTQTGVMLTVQSLGRVMVSQGRKGSLILVSDYSALVGCDPYNYIGAPEDAEEDFSADYGFVHGSYVNYARQTAGHLGLYGCRSNCIAYGPLSCTKSAAFEENFIRHTHIKRLANAEDIAGIAVFLASDASEYITGTTIPVDGGYVAK